VFRPVLGSAADGEEIGIETREVHDRDIDLGPVRDQERESALPYLDVSTLVDLSYSSF